MNIVFFGSSKHSTIVEQALHKAFGLSLVVTVTDKPVGRKKELTPSPVKKFADEQNIPVITADKLTPEIIERIKSPVPQSSPKGRGNESVDFLVVADYRLILPKELLAIPKQAALNVHHSLLPKYRGPSPAPAAILAGETKSGVSIIIMADKVDSGDILNQKEYVLKPDDTTDSLLTELNTLGAEIIIPVIRDFKTYYQKRQKQNESQATFTRYMKKTDGYIDAANPPSPEKIDRMIRAYYPWPNVWTNLRIKNQELRIKLLPSSCHPELAASQKLIPLGNVSGSYKILVQPEGKKPMTIKDFLNGYPEAREFIEKILGKN